jgi:hypothetical protein
VDRLVTAMQSRPDAPFTAPADTDPAAVRSADSLAILTDDPTTAGEELHRRGEEIGFSYFVFGAEVSDALAPVLAELAQLKRIRFAHEERTVCAGTAR